MHTERVLTIFLLTVLGLTSGMLYCVFTTPTPRPAVCAKPQANYPSFDVDPRHEVTT